MPHIAVLTFPGNNCEQETLRALKNEGFTGEIFLWNQPSEDLNAFDGVVIPGGFSFEDRGRSGIISAQEPVFRVLREMASKGIPILGICNGAQMLVESGLILEDSSRNIPAVSLLRNKRINNQGTILGTGYYHNWVTMMPVNKKTPFSNINHTIFAPIAHGEGRFTAPKEVEDEILKKNLIVFQYVTKDGELDSHYPTNPNGSLHNAAALCNPKGNVVAIMPHPERSESGQEIFKTFAEFFKAPWELNNEEKTNFSFGERTLLSPRSTDIEILVMLKITDKTQKSFETVLRKKYNNPNINIVRAEQWKISFKNTLSQDEKFLRAQEIITSHELLNTNKQSTLVKISDVYYLFTKSHGFEKIEKEFLKSSFSVQEKEDFVGDSKTVHLNQLFPEYGIKQISYAIAWEVSEIDSQKLLQLPLFASFVGEEVFAL